MKVTGKNMDQISHLFEILSVLRVRLFSLEQKDDHFIGKCDQALHNSSVEDIDKIIGIFYLKCFVSITSNDKSDQ